MSLADTILPKTRGHQGGWGARGRLHTVQVVHYLNGRGHSIYQQNKNFKEGLSPLLTKAQYGTINSAGSLCLLTFYVQDLWAF